MKLLEVIKLRVRLYCIKYKSAGYKRSYITIDEVVCEPTCSVVLQMWNTVTGRQMMDSLILFADFSCLSSDGNHVGVLRRHENGAVLLKSIFFTPYGITTTDEHEQ